MRVFSLMVFICLIFQTLSAQTVTDDFEGNGNITTWFGDDCNMDINFSNPFQEGINLSNTVLKYDDTGGQYANVRFDANANFDLSTNATFSLIVYVPSTGVSGNQPNQISLKLQDGTLGSPWTTQSEIIKPILLDQWQVVDFDFEYDNYINLDPNSQPPIQRSDFNRVVLQLNGENNNDLVVAYIDDFYFDETINTEPVFDNLVWSDEFNGNGAINQVNWFHQTQIPSGGSWYNGEIQHYTNRIDNSYESGGFLNIVAKEETYSDQGYTKQYTSARLNSKFAFTYGKVEIRAKLPVGVGTWPALWTLGQNINEPGAYWETQGYGSTGWPACGEIDIMEHWGDNQNYVQSALHTPSSFGNTMNVGGQTVTTASTDFHVYTLEWFADKMVFSVDGVHHYTYNPAVKNDDTWPFYEPQYLLFNVAILPNIDPNFSASAMEIDYVRIFQESTLGNDEQELTGLIKLYPNPVSEQLNIKMNHGVSRAIDFRITDLNGRIILGNSYDLINSQLSLNVSNLERGLYVIELIFGNGESTQLKFLKK